MSEDPQVVEIKLNPKAVWEDGTPITVADYVATWKALNGSNADYQVVSTTGWDQIGSVEQGSDEFDVKITFSSVFADWQSLFDGVLPAAIANDPVAFNTGFVDKAMPSSGPYVISNIDQTGQVITLTPEPGVVGCQAQARHHPLQGREPGAAGFVVREQGDRRALHLVERRPVRDRQVA